MLSHRGSSSTVHQQAMRERASRVDCAFRFPQKRVRLISYIVSIPPSPLGTASGEFLRPAASCLLLFRFLPKTLRKRQRRLFVPLPKCRHSPWKQKPSLLGAPEKWGRKRRHFHVLLDS